jgi:hypothetical protein
MEKQHMTNLANQKQMGASLPLVNVGTFSSQPSGYSSTNFTKNASDVNKELLQKASEGMQGLSYLLQEIHGEQNVNPNLHKAALDSLNVIKTGSHRASQQTDGIDYETQSITSQKYN